MPLGVGAVDADRHLARAVLAGRGRRAGRVASGRLGVGGDGVLEVEDQRVARDRLRLLQRTLVGGRHVEHRPPRPEVRGHASTSIASYCSFSSGSTLGQLLGELDEHQALLERGVVLHLAVEHHRAGAVAPVTLQGGHHATRVRDVLDARREDAVGDLDLRRVQAPRADAPEQEGVAELVLAGDRVGDVAERAVVREIPCIAQASTIRAIV